MLFRGIDYENLKEGDLIQFYGVHVLKWEDEIRPYGIEPRIAFVKDDSLEKENRLMREALEAVEWSKPPGTSVFYCVWCWNRMPQGHKENCKYKQALANTKKE